MSYPYQGMTDPTAVVGRRVLAAVIDGLVVLIPAAAVGINQLDLQYLDENEIGVSVSTFCNTFESQNDSFVCVDAGDRVYFSNQTPTLLTPVALGISLLMAVVLQAFTGFTLGKLITGIRTVREDGQVPGLGRALVRWLLLIVDTFPWCLPLVGFITALSTKGHRRVGDMAAHTFVVNKAAAGQPIVVPGMTTQAPTAYPAAAAGAWGAAPPGSGDAWGAQPGASWGRDPASSDSWAAAQGYPAPPSGERPAPPTSDPRPAPPGAPAPPAWAPAPAAEPQDTPADAPGAEAPPGDAPAEMPAETPAETPAGEHTVPFTGEPAPGAAVPDDVDMANDGDATQLHPGPDAEPDSGSLAGPAAAAAAGAAFGAPDAGAGPGAEGPGEGPGEAEATAAHPLDVAGPPSERPAAPGAEGEAAAEPASEGESAPEAGPGSESSESPAGEAAPEAGAAAGAAAASAEATEAAEPAGSGPDTDATIIAPPPAHDPDATVVGGPAPVPEGDADKTMVAPSTPGGPDAPAQAPAPASYNPQWDAARGTYIVWEPGRGKWLGWDDTAKEWRPL